LNAALLFDLDGTLVDTPRGILRAFQSTLMELGQIDCSESSIRSTIGTPLHTAFATILRTTLDDPSVAEAVKRYQGHFRRDVLPIADSLVFPAVRTTLQSLRERGWTLAVATSKVQASAEALLDASHLSEMFDLVVGADRVTHPKPHPEIATRILATLNADCRRSWMIGDTTHDLLMASAAGLKSIGVTYGVDTPEKLLTARPTQLVNQFAEILAIVNSGVNAVRSVKEAT
jgi:phosphoglycolate phosphatase